MKHSPGFTNKASDGPEDVRPFKTVSSKIAWSSPWYHVRQDQILLPDGTDGIYNVVEHAGAVWIVPVTNSGEVVLVRNYRYTVDDWCWEVPAGGLAGASSLEDAAIRELREEVGGSANAIEYIGQFYTSNGISNEVAHIFLAREVTLGATEHEAAEVIEVHTRAISDALQMARSNEISDGPSALAILLCEGRLLEIADNLPLKAADIGRD